MRQAKSLLILLSIISFSCTSVNDKTSQRLEPTYTYSICIDSIADQLDIDKKTYFILPGNEDINTNDLFFREYSRYLHRVLIDLGYQPAVYDNADFIIFLNFGVDKPQKSNQLLPITNWSTGHTTYITSSSTSYLKYAYISALDGLSFRSRKTPKAYWTTTLSTGGPSNDLRRAMPLLILAAKEYIGANITQTVKVEIDEADPRVSELKRPFTISEKYLSRDPVSTSESTGTCFAIANKIVVTNYHVIAEKQDISVKIGTDFYHTNLVARDGVNDIAVLEITNLPDSVSISPIPIGDASNTNKGDLVYTAGYPLQEILGDDLKISEGIINSKTGPSNDFRMFQISIPIQPGNSGSPLLNEYGHVIGIVTSTLNNQFLFVQTGTIPQNVNFSVKINYLLSITDQIPTLKPKMSYATDQVVLAASDVVKKYENSIFVISAK